MSIKLFFKLWRSLLWRLKIFLIFGWLGKGKQKIKIVIAEIKVWGMETKWQRLGDIARGTETVWRGLEVILQIWRLWGHFCRAYGASAPLHRCSCDEISKKKHSFLLSRNLCLHPALEVSLNNIKELSFFHKLRFCNPNTFATRSCRPLTFQTKNSDRSNNLCLK